MEYHLPLFAMSGEQLAALLAKLEDDTGLQEKFEGVADLDAALAIAKDAGFDVSKPDWHRYQRELLSEDTELSVEELAGVAGGINKLGVGRGLRRGDGEAAGMEFLTKLDNSLNNRKYHR